MKPSETIRYSEAFKRQVISELEAGKFRGPRAAARAYGIRGATTVSRWLRASGRLDLMPRHVTITTMEEHDEKKALKQRVRDLEKALADTQMKDLLGEAYLKIACRELGIPVEEFKKKGATKLSQPPKNERP